MIILILILLFQSSSPAVYATNHQTYYAKVLFEQVYLYKSNNNDDSTENIYFELPKTYFVELVDISGDFYKARYLNFTGFVKKDSVQAVSGTPNNPFLNNISFRVYSDLSQKLWSTPTTKNHLITEIPALTKNIQYIGKIHGECLIEGRTNVWYFCKYTTDKENYGYVYSDFCDEMPTIINNTEDVNYINNPTFQTQITPTKAIPKDSNAVGIVVGILSVPALIFVLMIMKGTRILSAEKIKSKEVVDY
ncbi:MAG: hypothetical protein J6Q13_02935 [Clostridia bacterium]|nr:hypothetical protein [Clostridia bacterium]